MSGELIFQTFIAMLPVAWQRAGRKGGFTYTPKKTRSAEDFIKFAVGQQWKEAPLDEPLDLEVFVFTEKPKSTPKRVLFPAVKPDWDNLGKLVGDSLNGILWKDDSRIVDGAVRKRFCDSAHPQPGYLLIVRRA